MAERKKGRGADTGPRRRKTPSRRARVETSAGGVIYRRNSDSLHVLLIRDPYENWGLPKGHLETGESPKDAALREVGEETGLTRLETVAELPRIDWYFRDRGKLIHKFCHFFLFESTAGAATPQIDEGISACIWLSLDDALRTITYDNAREVLRAAGRVLEAS